MKFTGKYIAKGSVLVIRLVLVSLWVPVAVDKLWGLQGFHSTLLRQPFPNWWADILFWLLPLAELSAAVLLAWPRSRKRTHQGMWLSATLMLAFTLFIGFGVLGWYEERPCDCGSVISGLSWENHLWFNAALFLLAAAGVWLTRPARGDGHGGGYRKPDRLFRRSDAPPAPSMHFTNKSCVFVLPKRFRRKFAVFRRRALQPLNPACTLYLIRTCLGQARRHVTGISTSVTGLI